MVGFSRKYIDQHAKTYLGIGLEVHEGPYLRGGTDDVIKSGHTFSNEPGVYIEGKVGYTCISFGCFDTTHHETAGRSAARRLLLYKHRG